jgi:hypothetical protein
MSREDEYDFLFKGISLLPLLSLVVVVVVGPLWHVAILGHFQKASADLCIVVLIGDSGVGMSSICNKKNDVVALETDVN